MNNMLDLCLLPLGTSQRRIRHRASQLFRSYPRRIAYLGDRELDLNDVGITLHHLDWTEHEFRLAGHTGFLLDFARSEHLWEFVHSPHGDEFLEMLNQGAPCLALGGAGEIFGSHLIDPSATPVLHILGDDKDLFAIDASHRRRRDIELWQMRFPIPVCSIEPDGEWRIEKGRKFTSDVTKIVPGGS
jgi:hypothetical protein